MVVINGSKYPYRVIYKIQYKMDYVDAVYYCYVRLSFWIRYIEKNMDELKFMVELILVFRCLVE